MEKPIDLSVTEAEWQQTPGAVQQLVLRLWQEFQQLRAEVASLRERLEQSSRNSSRPPLE